MKKTKKNQRRIPVQARSRAKYNAILDASARVILKDGYNKASTDKIATEADVAIGTLYEYFGSKDEIFAAYINQQLRHGMAQMRGEVLAHMEFSVEAMLDLIIHMSVEFILERQQVFSVILREVPELWEVEVINMIEDKVVDIFSQFSDQLNSKISIRKRREMAFFVTNVLMGVYMRLTMVGLKRFKPKDLEQELACVIRGYIREKLDTE